MTPQKASAPGSHRGFCFAEGARRGPPHRGSHHIFKTTFYLIYAPSTFLLLRTLKKCSKVRTSSGRLLIPRGIPYISVKRDSCPPARSTLGYGSTISVYLYCFSTMLIRSTASPRVITSSGTISALSSIHPRATAVSMAGLAHPSYRICCKAHSCCSTKRPSTVKSCAHVVGLSGAKYPFPVPPTTPASDSASTKGAYQAPPSTSVKERNGTLNAATLSSSNSRYTMVAICARESKSSSWSKPSPYPCSLAERDVSITALLQIRAGAGCGSGSTGFVGRTGRYTGGS